MIIKRFALLTASALLLLPTACSRPTEPVAPPPEGTPKLVLFLVVDQLRADYMTRFESYYSDGFSRLLEESVNFTTTNHNHAGTKTAVGHSTLMTGAHPSRHGIIGNSWYDRDSGSSVDADEDSRYTPDRAPTRMLVSTLGDWLKATYPKSRVFTASMKSRAAVTMGGQSADASFWYDDDTGRFTTSDYYVDQEPAWLEEFHQDSLVERFFGTSWQLLPEVEAAIEPLGLEQVNRGILRRQMPRPVGRSTTVPTGSYYSDFLGESPFGDAYLGELAWALMQNEPLGQDAYPDILALSFSSLDYIGHRYGPNSAEVLDTMVRLDRVIGDLLSRIDASLGLENVVVSLASDHGVAPIPEYSGTRRFWIEERGCLQHAEQALDARFGAERWLEWDLVLDRDLLASRSIDQARAETVLAEAIAACPGIERVWTATQLAGGELADPVGQLYARNFYPGRSPDFEIQVESGAISSNIETNHGTPYDYDRRVPWLLRFPSPRPQTVAAPVFTVDTAPTLADYLGIDIPHEIDGVSRLDLISDEAAASTSTPQEASAVE